MILGGNYDQESFQDVFIYCFNWNPHNRARGLAVSVVLKLGLVEIMIVEVAVNPVRLNV